MTVRTNKLIIIEQTIKYRGYIVMLFKKEKLKFIKHWNAYNGTEIWGEDDKNIEKEFNYWTEEEPFTHNQITRGT